MKSVAVPPPPPPPHPPPLTFSSSFSHLHHRLSPLKFHLQSARLRILCSSNQSESIKTVEMDSRPEYKPGIFDDLFLNLFRNQMEVGWDSEKAGYDGLIEVANRLMMRRSNSKRKKPRALPNAHITYSRRESSCNDGCGSWSLVLLTLWIFLMGSSLRSGVFVERCKYLEQSKCVGICINTCKLPTQTFFKDYMGVPLLMEPNFNDYSCQFNFGVLPPPEDDSALKEPCLEICPNASRRRVREFSSNAADVLQCPRA